MAIRFRGEYELRVDDKARLAIPANYRQALDQAGDRRLILVKSTSAKCLQAWPQSDWEAYEDKILALAASEPTALKLLRFQVAGNAQVEPDTHGRVVLPPTLRAYAGIDPSGEVVVASLINRFEIWARSRWQAEQNQIEDDLPNWSADLARLGL
ncbi:MAG: division/cell wall cluster transcriptional repressor MraZ [Deltaproteobacteria bacterium]|nr:division/cell wall cluster transcriptional repressor MraZ [Deltaproteobacteria bacterium]